MLSSFVVCIRSHVWKLSVWDWNVDGLFIMWVNSSDLKDSRFFFWISRKSLRVCFPSYDFFVHPATSIVSWMVLQIKGTFSWDGFTFLRAVSGIMTLGTFQARVWTHTIFFSMPILLAVHTLNYFSSLTGWFKFNNTIWYISKIKVYLLFSYGSKFMKNKFIGFLEMWLHAFMIFPQILWLCFSISYGLIHQE